MATMDERERLREALRAAIAAEHRVCEAATAEDRAARRWAERATLAQRKEAPDLAEAARQRAAAHTQRARAYQAESQRARAEIARLKAALLYPAPVPRVAVLAPGESADARLAALDREAQLERDLAELKRQLGRQ